MGVLCSLVLLSPHPPQALSPCQMRAVALRVSARPQAHLCWCRRRLAGPVMGPGGPWGAPGTLAGLPTPVVGPVSRGGAAGWGRVTHNWTRAQVHVPRGLQVA